MSEYDQWQIAGVLPGDYMEFDEWVFLRPDMPSKEAVTGVVCHKHVDGSKVTLYMTSNNKCRVCSAEAPPGVLFLARAHKLHDLGD